MGQGRPGFCRVECRSGGGARGDTPLGVMAGLSGPLVPLEDTRRRSGSGSPSCPFPRARPPFPSNARQGTPLTPRTAWALQPRSRTQVGLGLGGGRLLDPEAPLQLVCAPPGYHRHRRESQDEEPRAVLAQRIEKETVGGWVSARASQGSPCPSPVANPVSDPSKSSTAPWTTSSGSWPDYRRRQRRSSS